MKHNVLTVAVYFVASFLQYGLPLAYFIWAIGVLEYSSGSNSIDARELLFIYPLSVLGLVVLVATLRKKFIQWFEGARLGQKVRPVSTQSDISVE